MKKLLSVLLLALFMAGSGEAFTIPDLSMEMLWCPPGNFIMGSPSSEEGRRESETQHAVTLTKGFWLGKYEVTQAQWGKVMGTNTNPSKIQGAYLPVETVSWSDAVAFCKKLTERERKPGRVSAEWVFTLPTEAQWEYACRAGTKTAYSFGNTIRSKNESWNMHANSNDNIWNPTAVGSYLANPWGFHDMHGNVWEWCRDWYGTYSTGSVTDPTGPASGSYRVRRGGSWLSPGAHLRSAVQSSTAPGSRSPLLGFRVAYQFIGK